MTAVPIIVAYFVAVEQHGLDLSEIHEALQRVSVRSLRNSLFFTPHFLSIPSEAREPD
jgi:hypothetical protein